MGERIDNKGAWQMPQGGVNLSKNECLLSAAKRELFEETGISSIKYICESKEWHYYYLPNYLSKKLWRGKFIGQKQKWFLLKLTASDEKVNLQASGHPEFDGWRWVSYWYPVRQVVAFKREVYRKMMHEFSSIMMAPAKKKKKKKKTPNLKKTKCSSSNSR